MWKLMEQRKTLGSFSDSLCGVGEEAKMKTNDEKVAAVGLVCGALFMESACQIRRGEKLGIPFRDTFLMAARELNEGARRNLVLSFEEAIRTLKEEV